MLGNAVNALAILAGGTIGLLFKKFIKESWTDTLNKGMGLAVLVIGINGVIANMMKLEGGKLSSSGELLLVISLVVGGLTGELLRLDERLDRFSRKVEQKFSKGGVADSVMSATVLFVVGAMAILGPIEEGLTGNHTILFVKATLDGVSAVVCASTLGYGVLFSAVPVFLYQSVFWALAGVVQPYLAEGPLLSQICMVGYAVIIGIGFNFILKGKIKTLNLLPSVLVPAVWYLITSLR